MGGENRIRTEHDGTDAGTGCDNRWIAGKSSNFLFESKAEGGKIERPNKEEGNKKKQKKKKHNEAE